MTDAAVPVTQSAVERFTERYLRSLGCTIEKRGERWHVGVADEDVPELPAEDFTLRCGTATENDGDTAEPLHAQSQFFQELLIEASERAPAGKISFDTENSEIRVPDWLRESEFEVSEATFSPLYDRNAVVFLFRVSIETVSEFQTEILRAAATDVRSGDPLRTLEETFLSVTSLEGQTVTTEAADLERSEIEPLLEDARERISSRVQPEIDEIHEEASRAADAEVEEYRQLQQQRISELEETRENLSSKIADLNDSIQGSDQTERVQALKERKELNNEYDELDSELTELRKRRDRGYPEKQREIRQRHALEVKVSPLTVTQVEYERGELELHLRNGETTRSISVGYGTGVGQTEAVRCDSCDRQFTDQRLPDSLKNGLRCQKCASPGDSG